MKTFLVEWANQFVWYFAIGLIALVAVVFLWHVPALRVAY